MQTFRSHNPNNVVSLILHRLRETLIDKTPYENKGDY